MTIKKNYLIVLKVSCGDLSPFMSHFIVPAVTERMAIVNLLNMIVGTGLENRILDYVTFDYDDYIFPWYIEEDGETIQEIAEDFYNIYFKD